MITAIRQLYQLALHRHSGLGPNGTAEEDSHHG